MNLAMEMSTSNEWHLIKGEVKYGPYTYAELIHMMQEKIVFNFDYVWAPHLDSWTPIGELAEFTTERLSLLAEKNKDSKVFNRREHERVHCDIDVYIHDNQKLWEGKAENLSEGGALLLIRNPMLLPGDMVHIHFKKTGEEDISINVTAEILTKRLTKSRIQFNTGVHYAVKFVKLSKESDRQINNWIQKFKSLHKKGA